MGVDQNCGLNAAGLLHHSVTPVVRHGNSVELPWLRTGVSSLSYTSVKLEWAIRCWKYKAPTLESNFLYSLKTNVTALANMGYVEEEGVCLCLALLAPTTQGTLQSTLTEPPTWCSGKHYARNLLCSCSSVEVLSPTRQGRISG